VPSQPEKIQHKKKILSKSDSLSRTSSPPKFWSTSLEVIGVASFILAVISIYFQFYPSIKVSPIESTFTDNFQDAKFQATNESPIPLYNVVYATAFWDGVNPKGFFPVTTFDLAEILPPHASMSMRIQIARVHSPDTSFGEIDRISKSSRPMMEIVLLYSPFNLKFLQTKISRLFWAYKTKNNVYVWGPSGHDTALFRGNKPIPRLYPE
jgi:hypothetical protein